MPSPPKPWEVNNTSNNVVSTAASTPSVPARLSTVNDNSLTNNIANRPAAYGATTGVGGYNSYGSGYGSSYGNNYNRYGSSYGNSFGGYGGMSGYGGMGGYGGMSSYGGMGGYNSYGGGMGGYGGMNRYGMNRMGPGGPEDMSLTQRMEMGTRSTFEVIENIVGAFGGFAQMLDSTFMATHSSFMAMVGVAEQLGFLKNYLGQVFSILAVYRLIKKVVNKVTGRVPPGKPMEMNFNEFQQFESKIEKNATTKMSRKPLIMFLLMVVGLPYMMHKLIKLISSNPKFQQQQAGRLTGPEAAAVLDPSKLEFARATYDFNAESQMELTLKKGDIVAIISKATDPASTAPSPWWRGRLRDGAMGLFPANYVEIIQKGNTDSDEIVEGVLKNTLDKATFDNIKHEEPATKLI
ncbi:Peroxin 13, N-terminal region-domain-containing protein [Pilobolus umbonatus]|nr:Peroxin 13, N-terminal region-domain-containing protein [Pilobolus umbonatus]